MTCGEIGGRHKRSLSAKKKQSVLREEPPSKRRRMDFLMLPDDLVLNCLARVSRLYYPILSLVSKKFRSLLASTELYQTRTLLDRTESCLYVCLRQRTYSSSKTLGWFTLCRRPNSSKKILVPISYPNYALWTEAAVVIGPNIYAIGGFVNNNNNISYGVMVMNCRTHTWREAPRMQVARRSQYSTCVLDGKIYVTGGRKNFDATKWMEVFDTKTQTWEFMHTPNEKICRGLGYESVGCERSVYVRSWDNNVIYKLHKGRWIKGDLEMNRGWNISSYVCVIDNVFYSCNRSHSGTIDWYNSQKRLWTTLKGLERLPRLGSSVKLADYGGKMMVLWKEYKYVKKHSWEITIWCAEIAIKKRQNGEIWGMLEWFDAVYTNANNVHELHLSHAVVTTI